METAQPAYQENHRLEGPTGFQAAHAEALRRAGEALLAADTGVCCAGAGAVFETCAGGGSIQLRSLNRTIRITVPALDFKAGTDGKKIPTWEKIIILHYLVNSERAGLKGTHINYRSLRDGALYAGPFEQRCIRPLLAAFGDRPGALHTAAAGLGGVAAVFGDCAVSIPALPHIDIICCLWKGDAEFAPEAGILFDAGAEDFLCAEDIAVLCQQIVLALIKNRLT